MRRSHGASARLLACECTRQLRICAVTWSNGDEMAANSATDEGEIADDVQDLVPDEFIGKTHRLLAQDSVAANDDRVLQTSSLDQVFIHERLHVLVKNKRARRRDLTFENRRRNFERQILREAIVRSGLRAGDAKFVVRKQNEQRTA